MPLLAALLTLLFLPAAPAIAGNGADTLYGNRNETLYRDQSLFSTNRTYEAKMQSDGNFVLYGPNGPIWASHTSGGGNSRLVMQTDGDLVIYNGNGAATWSTYTSNGVNKIKPTAAVAYARKQLGKAYVYGASGPNSFDRSGLTSQAYASVGVGLNRTSQDQFRQGSAVGIGDLQPGDLVFYRGNPPGHVAIYAGNGQIIEALNPSTGVAVHSLNYPGTPVGARRTA